MSSAESFISGHSMHTDNVTNGLNPIYKSVSGSTQYTQCEYDEIKDGHSNLLAPTLPNQTITTPNTMYVSKGDSLQHHKMNLDQVYQLASIPEENEYQEKESRCKCSADAFICVMSILSMLLSGAVIVLVLLLWFGVVTNNAAYTSVGTATSSINTTTSTTTTNTTTTNTTTTNTTTNNISSEQRCNCSFITPMVSLTSLMEIEQNLSYISLELEFINNQNLNISRLNDILSLIKSVNDSVEQINEKCSLLRSISGNNDSISETCPPNITAVNQPASIGINISDECTTIRKTPCSVDAVPSQLTTQFCETETINIVIDDTILVDFTCHLAFEDDSEDPVKGVGIIRTDSLSDVPPGDVFENLLSDTARISCQCVSFEPKEVDCVTYETRCHYKRGPIDTHINT